MSRREQLRSGRFGRDEARTAKGGPLCGSALRSSVKMAPPLSVGEVVFSGVALGVLVVLYPFIFRWAGLEPDPFDERQVASRRNCRVLVFTVPGLILVQVLRLVLDISNLH